MKLRPGIRHAVGLVALTLALSACGAVHGIVGGSQVPNVGPAGTPMTYVAIGASETVGIGAADPLRDGWAYRFYRKALPRAAIFVNLGVPGATVTDALQREVPEAVALHPDLVTVWLNVNDIIAGVPPQTYETELQKLLARLRGARILVANVPSLAAVPRFFGATDIGALVAAYNAAIARASRAAGATVVDLRPLANQLDREGKTASLLSSDGLHPNTAGYAEIARVFEQAWQPTR